MYGQRDQEKQNVIHLFKAYPNSQEKKKRIVEKFIEMLHKILKYNSNQGRE